MRYRELLLLWNEKMNLTAITDPQEILVKHFLDSLLTAKALPLYDKASLADVGCGAGFPSIPLGIYRPALSLTLIDSLGKRLRFLDEVISELGLSARTVHARAEEAGRKAEHREQYDFVTARAVAAMPVLCEYCLPLVKTGGFFAALKGPEVELELDGARVAIQTLGGTLEEIQRFTLPDGSGRSIVVIQKTASTPQKYPRPSAQIAKKHL